MKYNGMFVVMKTITLIFGSYHSLYYAGFLLDKFINHQQPDARQNSYLQQFFVIYRETLKL